MAVMTVGESVDGVPMIPVPVESMDSTHETMSGSVKTMNEIAADASVNGCSDASNI